MNGLSQLENFVLVASHDAKNNGMAASNYEKPVSDLKELKSLLAKLMRATFNGDINPNHPIGPGMQREISSVAKQIDKFLNK